MPSTGAHSCCLTPTRSGLCPPAQVAPRPRARWLLFQPLLYSGFPGILPSSSRNFGNRTGPGSGCQASLRKVSPKGECPRECWPRLHSSGHLWSTFPEPSIQEHHGSHSPIWPVLLLNHPSLALKKENQQGRIQVGKLSPRCFLAEK